MEQHTSNIHSSVPPQKKLEAGMEVLCINAPHDAFKVGKYYLIKGIGGYLEIPWSESLAWRIHENGQGYLQSLMHFDLLNPRWPEAEKVKDDNNGWISVKDRLPIGGTTGNWDGVKSEPILAIDKNEICHVCVVYSGALDGHRFADFYELDDCDVPDVTHWQPLPSPPNQL